MASHLDIMAPAVLAEAVVNEWKESASRRIVGCAPKCAESHTERRSA